VRRSSAVDAGDPAAQHPEDLLGFARLVRSVEVEPGRRHLRWRVLLGPGGLSQPGNKRAQFVDALAQAGELVNAAVQGLDLAGQAGDYV
jgi:hypothetical protein